MSLVRKMKVNFSKHQFNSKTKPTIIRERHPYYSSDQDKTNKLRKIIVKSSSPESSIYSNSIHQSTNSIVNGLSKRLEKISVAEKVRRQSSSGSEQGFLPPVTQLSIQQTKKLLYEQKKARRDR